MNGGFASLHPLPCFVYYVGVILFSMLLFHPVFLATAIVIIIWLTILHNSGKKLRRLLPFYILMGGLVALLNPLFSHRGRHILFYFLEQPVTLEAVLYGITMMLSLLTILITFVSYHSIITTDKFMYLFSTITPKLSLLTLMTIRFVPLFKRRMHQISLIQSTKGISIHQGSLQQRVRHGMVLLRVLLTWSLEEALQTADSMKGRGYGVAKRSMYITYRMDRRDVVVLAVMSMMGALCIVGWTRGWGILDIYPRLESITWTWGEGSVYVIFCCFLLVPVLIEGREKMRWKSYK